MESESNQVFNPNSIVKKNTKTTEGGLDEDIVRAELPERYKFVNKKIKITKTFVLISAAFLIIIFSLIAFYFHKLG